MTMDNGSVRWSKCQNIDRMNHPNNLLQYTIHSLYKQLYNVQNVLHIYQLPIIKTLVISLDNTDIYRSHDTGC